MCIAIYLPRKKTIDRETLYNCYTTNPDGMGFAYWDEAGNLIVRKFVGQDKIMLGIEEFLMTREHYIKKQMMIHFRIASHGKISKKTCHPFVVNKDTVFCHNGILSDFTKQLSLSSKISDTMLFNRKVLKKLPTNFIDQPLYKKMLEEMIGTWNKMIIMESDGRHWILNEEQGEWSNGVWFSNDSYKSYDYSYDSLSCSAIVPHKPFYKRALSYVKKFITKLPEMKEAISYILEED